MNTLNRLFGFADDVNVIPVIRIRSRWTKENKHGFLSGIAKFGLPGHKQRLSEILQLNSHLQDNEKEIDKFIDICYDFYINPFKQHAGNSCHTPSPSRPSSRSNSAHDINENDIHIPAELSHSHFRTNLVHRDGVCLFCWNSLECHAAHIVAQEDLPFEHDEQSILQSTGLQSKHQVQNGMLLCIFCHAQFDKLKMYVDVVDEDHGGVKYVLKIVKGLMDSDAVVWSRAIRDTRGSRQLKVEDHADGREVMDNGDNMCLWFINPTANIETRRETRSGRELEPEDLRPNIKALEFHKNACLIWHMAGGAEDEDEYCSDYDSDADQENIPYNQLTEDFVSATAASLKEAVSLAAFQPQFLDNPDLETPK